MKQQTNNTTIQQHNNKCNSKIQTTWSVPDIPQMRFASLTTEGQFSTVAPGCWQSNRLNSFPVQFRSSRIANLIGSKLGPKIFGNSSLAIWLLPEQTTKQMTKTEWSCHLACSTTHLWCQAVDKPQLHLRCPKSYLCDCTPLPTVHWSRLQHDQSPRRSHHLADECLH